MENSRKSCQFCSRAATYRLQAQEDEFGAFGFVSYSCTHHQGWLLALGNNVNNEGFQTLTLNVPGFSKSGVALDIDDSWEVI